MFNTVVNISLYDQPFDEPETEILPKNYSLGSY